MAEWGYQAMRGYQLDLQIQEAQTKLAMRQVSLAMAAMIPVMIAEGEEGIYDIGEFRNNRIATIRKIHILIGVIAATCDRRAFHRGRIPCSIYTTC